MFREEQAPDRLPEGQVTVLSISGNVFLATLRAIERSLPSPDGARSAVVILALRGQVEAATGLFRMLERYARQVRAHGSWLILAEVDLGLLACLSETGAAEVIGESILEAIRAAGR